MHVHDGEVFLCGNDGERGYDSQGRPIGTDGRPNERDIPLSDWDLLDSKRDSVLVPAPGLGTAGYSHIESRDNGGITDTFDLAPGEMAPEPLVVGPGDLDDIPDLIHPDASDDGTSMSKTPIKRTDIVVERKAAKRARRDADRAQRQARAALAAEEAKALAHQRQERHAMHIAEDETRATDAARTEADARAAGQVRADARRKARRQAKREATARAKAALDQREASLTDED